MNKRRGGVGWILVTLAGLAVIGWLVLPRLWQRVQMATLQAPKVTGATEVGIIASATNAGIMRDGGTSILSNGSVLWAFGDSLFPRPATDGKQLRSNTAARASLSTPLAAQDALDAAQAPRQFIPFTAEELAYNNAKNAGDDRYALWPGEFLRGASGELYVGYSKVKIGKGQLNFTTVAGDVARVDESSLSVTRPSIPLFSAPETPFVHAYVQHDDTTYSYACDAPKLGTQSLCKVAQVPTNSLTDRAAYRFWDGHRWQGSIDKAVSVVPGSTSGFSVRYSGYLQKYVSVQSKAFSNTIELRVAASPEGPWSTAVTAYRADGPLYATNLHPELDADGGAALAITYYRDLGNFKGELRLIRVQLAR